ncbi:variant 4 [Lathyrus oleraceus]|uniref:Variant 4 n=1 Tax=Pisum sativum TaxID=3888 RepID=A0A9D5BP34_PEA|nr:variant 4 [Pisum sativum]
MESSSAITLSHLPYVYPAIPNTNRKPTFWPAGKRRNSQLSTRLHCNKMFVPGLFTASFLYLVVVICDVLLYMRLSIIVCTMVSWIQDLVKHHRKQRLLKTSTISSPSLLLKSLLLNLRFFPT